MGRRDSGNERWRGRGSRGERRKGRRKAGSSPLVEGRKVGSPEIGLLRARLDDALWSTADFKPVFNALFAAPLFSTAITPAPERVSRQRFECDAITRSLASGRWTPNPF